MAKRKRKRPPPMSHREFGDALDALDLSESSRAGKVLDVPASRVREWRTGYRKVPRYAAAHIEALAYLQLYMPDRFQALVEKRLNRPG